MSFYSRGVWGTFHGAETQEFLCCSVSSTPCTLCGQSNTSPLCWHVLFTQPGTAVRDAITQFNYHIEFNGLDTHQTVVGSMITPRFMAQHPCNIPFTHSDEPLSYTGSGELASLEKNKRKREKNTISLIFEKSCMTEGSNAFIFVVMAEEGKCLNLKVEEKQHSGLLSEATLEPTRSESETVTVYMKLASALVTRDYFCVHVAVLISQVHLVYFSSSILASCSF